MESVADGVVSTVPVEPEAESYAQLVADQARTWFEESVQDRSVIHLAQLILAKFDTLQDDEMAAAVSIQQFVSKYIPYVHDPLGNESIMSPMYMAREILNEKYASADCDDKSIFCAALMRAVGLDATVAFMDANKTGSLNHAITVVYIGDELYFAEASVPAKFGWHPEYTKLWLVTPLETSVLQVVE